MDMFKKIYTALIFMTILSLGYLCLVTLEVIEVNLMDETSLYIMTTAIYVFIMSILFSRAANVIANRNARYVGYIATFIGLINLLLVALQMIIHNNEFLVDASNIMIYVTIFAFLIVLVFEIPKSNSAHGKFQIATAIIIAITALFPYITGLKKLDDSIISLNGTSTYTLDQNNIENIETLEKINTILTFLSIGTFILNPMLRVYYIDKDYAALNEINDAFETASKYQANTEPDPYELLSDKYKKDAVSLTQPVPTPIPEPLPEPMISEIQPVVEEMPTEKVLNQQFHPEELPEAIIPSIGGIENTPNPLEAATQPEPTPVVESIPNPLEAATQPSEENILNIVKPTE